MAILADRLTITGDPETGTEITMTFPCAARTSTTPDID
jgi:hypothetical protein